MTASFPMLHDRLIPYIEATSPDVLCLQEVVHTPLASSEWLTYRDGDHVLPQRANFFREVAAALPDHVASFCPAAQGVLWDDEKPVPSQWGLATFVAARFPIIGQVQAFVHKSFSANGYGAHPRPRNAHAVRLHDFQGQRAICIAHMHGLRDLDGKMDTQERMAQAHRLAGIVTDVAQEGDSLVVCGDFNVLPGSATFEVLGELGIRDLVTTGEFGGTRTSYYRKSEPFADYMLVGPTVEVNSFEVVREPEVSDHCPLLLEI